MKSKKEFILWFIAIAILLNILAAVYMSFEHYIYFWDVSSYWERTMQFIESPDKLQVLYNSINLDEYNFFPCIPFMLTYKLFGCSYTVFIMTILNFFVLPFILLFLLLLFKIWNTNSRLRALLCMLAVISFVPMLTPMIRGYLDSAGLLFTVIALWALYRMDFSKFDGVSAGILFLSLTLMAFTRRWYSFFLLTVFFAYYPVAIIFYRKHWLKITATFFAAGAAWLIFTTAFFPQFFKMLVANDYAAAYSAYQIGNLLDNIKLFVGHIGWVYLLIALAGFILGVRDKQNRPFCIAVFVQSILIFFIFTHIQSIGIQHCYLFVPSLLFFICTFIIKVSSKAIPIATAVFLAANMAHTYIPHRKLPISFLFTERTCAPRVRDDIEQIREMAEYINSRAKDDETVYVLASSFIMNWDILRNVNMPDVRNAVRTIVFTHDVDLRDGFPDYFYDASYIVVCDPVQYHLRPETQRTIGILADAILSGEDCDNLELIKTYELDEGVTAKVYYRTGEYSAAFKQKIAEQFHDAYPDVPALHPAAE